MDYAYNSRGQLSDVNDGDILYSYDHAGRRVQQNVGGSITQYLWDEFSQYGDVVLETVPFGNSLAHSAHYSLANGMLINQTVGTDPSQLTTLYFLTDAQGSTRAMTETDGDVKSSYAYDAFGNLQAGVNQLTSDTKYLYTGQQYDFQTELYSLRARYYDPSIGRFTSRDTWAYNYGNPIELNRYVYAANNPVRWSDPTGYAKEEYSFGIANAIQAIRFGGAIAGAIVGATLGTLAGAIYGALTFPMINAGMCGSRSTYNASYYEYIMNSAMWGALFGGVIGAGVGYYSVFGTIVAGKIIGYLGAAGLGLAAGEFLSDAMKGQLNVCAGVDAIGSVLAIEQGYEMQGLQSPLGMAREYANWQWRQWFGSGDIETSFIDTDGLWTFIDQITGNIYKVGLHGEMPSPRPNQESHHGIMSAWMRTMFREGYNPDLVPTILMPTEQHGATINYWWSWRARMKIQLGGVFDWTRVTYDDMVGLSQSMMDEAEIPQPVQQEWWNQWNAFWEVYNDGAIP